MREVSTSTYTSLPHGRWHYSAECDGGVHRQQTNRVLVVRRQLHSDGEQVASDVGGRQTARDVSEGLRRRSTNHRRVVLAQLCTQRRWTSHTVIQVMCTGGKGDDDNDDGSSYGSSNSNYDNNSSSNYHHYHHHDSSNNKPQNRTNAATSHLDKQCPQRGLDWVRYAAARDGHQAARGDARREPAVGSDAAHTVEMPPSPRTTQRWAVCCRGDTTRYTRLTSPCQRGARSAARRTRRSGHRPYAWRPRSWT
jgi:hypothetical protein